MVHISYEVHSKLYFALSNPSKRPSNISRDCQRAQTFLNVIGMLCINVEIFSPVCIQLNIMDGLESVASVPLFILQLFWYVVYGCKGVCNVRLSHLSSLLTGLIAAWTKRTRPSSRPVPNFIFVAMGNATGFFAKFATRMFVGMCRRVFIIPGPGTRTPFCIEFGYGRK